MKRFFKSMAVVGVSASGSYSRRGSAFSTKSQETAVNLTDINLHLSEKPNEGNDEEEYEGDGGKMDLDAVLGDENNNEHEYDHDYSDKEQDQESQNNYYATHDAMLTTEMELELHRHREEKSMKRQTVRRLQHLHQLRCQGLLSDGDNSLLLKNNSDSMVDHVSSPLIEQQQEHLHRLSPIQLPEILHLIFQFVVDFTPQEEYSQREIYNCMLVSKQWYLVAQKTLWHEIRFKTPTKLGCFIDLLKRTEGKGGVSPEKTNYSVQQQQIQLTEIDDKDRIRQQQGTHRRQRHESIQYRQKHQLTESIMAPEAMQRRLHERAMAVKKIVLHKLKLIEDQDIMPLTSWFHNLQILEFYICEKLTDVTVAAIAENCPRLQQLLMPGCAKVTDQGISQIALHCPRMKHLDLRACSNVSDESLVLVARHCSELWHLNVGRVSAASKVTGKSIVEIAKNTNLNTLGLAGCAMTDDAVIDIARYSRSGLHRISLNSCPMLTSASVRALMQLCPNLAVLEIKQCLLVTDMATLYRFSTRRVLVELCPELQKRFLEYKVGVVTMNTSAQFNNIHPSVSSTQQAQGPNGQDSMSSAQTTATMTTVADNNGSNINSNNNNNSSIMIANDNVSMIQPTTTTVASHP
ncbi:hypothetical protein BCR41DRAFT_370458 [Lobosporangium transversale]|uniref:Uncharacterized protein n=1 Tax=Lobosporangium transversale TaxID=64571 RepID=A0A1Y2GPZ3_9FUNG|nr:hypothetical protein BCR41DRAFT_370458 [Lobosporangium transversale]ORZ16664.1 hypothetical protein BCR41DRAFT_370458 [Lobosporangium transversale]|eukprot:XP_021881599.1 hypothetical protein BCR41DRAFT_370458 [Lobosporangium transversale]